MTHHPDPHPEAPAIPAALSAAGAALALPDAPGFSWDALVAAWVPDDRFRHDDPPVQRYYATKAAITCWLRPTALLEIGVRAGYSALAFHMGHPFARYLGLDADNGQWGGVTGYLAHASTLISQLPGVTGRVEPCDTQRVAALPTGYDVIHVDGDHSWAGALHDIRLALETGARYVIVDDYLWHVRVRAAAHQVLRDRPGLTAVVVDDDHGYRGNLVIANTGVAFPPVPPLLTPTPPSLVTP